MANKNNSVIGIVAKEGYEARVGMQALKRAGKCSNLNGHVHELMFCDKYNVNPSHLLRGKQAHLTKSATATVKDVIMMKGSKVVGHASSRTHPASAE